MSGRFTEGVREPLVTATAHGLMLAADKAKLDATTGTYTSADAAKLATLQVPVSRLTYGPATDHLSGAAIAAGTWTDIHANQSFTVGSATAWLAVAVRLGLVATGAVAAELAMRALFDSGGSALGVWCGAAMVPAAGSWGALSGGAFYLLPGFAAGTHTVKLQIYGNGAFTAYCRAASQPNNEFLSIHVVELSK